MSALTMRTTRCLRSPVVKAIGAARVLASACEASGYPRPSPALGGSSASGKPCKTLSSSTSARLGALMRQPSDKLQSSSSS